MLANGRLDLIRRLKC